MTKILSIDRKKIDEVLDEFSKLIIRLGRNSKKTKNDENRSPSKRYEDERRSAKLNHIG